jgi:LysM repeat protein
MMNYGRYIGVIMTDKTSKSWYLAVCGLLALLAGLLVVRSSGLVLPAAGAAMAPDAATGPVLGRKAVLEYLFLNQELADMAVQELGLSMAELSAIKELARQEGDQLRALESASEMVASNTRLSVAEKQIALRAVGYQDRFDQILQGHQAALQQVLDHDTYTRLVEWIERRWQVERALHGSPQVPANQVSGPRTYTVFATRYDAGGAYTVALPDKCVKFSNAGIASQTECTNYGYADGANYSISIAYKGRSVTVRPLEAGPWNIDDTFWATAGDPTPRRMFADLPLGVPQAQAAYFDNYNGGLDQFGRKVNQPFAIDLSYDVARDLGFTGRDWVDVTFIWTAGWGSPDSPSGEAAPGVPQIIIPVATGTPDAEGQLFHDVQPGQTLWAIALAYEVTIDDLEAWNNLSRQDSLLIGERLVIPDSNTKIQGTPTPMGMILVEDGRIIHLVQPDENLIMIAERYRVELETILMLNEIQADQPLQIGQQLLIQAPRDAPARPLTAIEKLTPHSDGRYYHIVSDGESLSSIADLYEIPLPDLMSWNELGEAAVIQPGETLLLQVTPPATATATPVPHTATPVATPTASATLAPTRTLEAASTLISSPTAPADAAPAESGSWILWAAGILVGSAIIEERMPHGSSRGA